MENSKAMYRGQAGTIWEGLDLDDFLGVKKKGWSKLGEYEFKDIRNEARFNYKYGDPYDYVYITRLRAVYGVIGYLPSIILLAFAIRSASLDALVCAIVAIAITAMVTIFMACEFKCASIWTGLEVYQKAKRVLNGEKGVLFAKYNEGDEFLREIVLRKLFDEGKLDEKSYKDHVCEIYLGYDSFFDDQKSKEYRIKKDEFMSKHEFL